MSAPDSEVQPAVPRLPEFQGFFDGLAAGRLAFPCCRRCGRHHWYPMPRCPSCLAAEIDWRPVAGRGEILSFTVVRHAFDKGRALPYVVALVTFPDAPGVRLVTRIVGVEPDGLAIGLPVQAVIDAAATHAGTVDFALPAKP